MNGAAIRTRLRAVTEYRDIVISPDVITTHRPAARDDR